MTYWDKFATALSHKEPATPLALFRIAIALVLAFDLLDIWMTKSHLMIWFPMSSGGMQPPNSNWLFHLLGGPSSANIEFVLWGTLLCCLVLLMGIGSRVAALIAIQGCLALFALHPGTGGGHDRLITNALWLLVLAPSDTSISLWSKIRTGNWFSSSLVSAWPRYLVIYQLILMYSCTGIQKLGAEWWPMGDFLAIYYAILIPYWARADWSWIAQNLTIATQIGTFLTWAWESTWWVVLLCFYYRKTSEKEGRIRQLFLKWDIRLVYITIGVFVHTGIALLMNLGPFSGITMSYYLCFFHHDEYTKVLAKVKQRFQKSA